MNIENQLYILYASGTEEKIDPLPDNYLTAIDDACPLPVFNLSDRETYYSYLHDAIANHPEKNFENKDDLDALDTIVAQHLYQDGVEYPKIIHIMTNSASAYLNPSKEQLSDKERQSLGVIKTMAAVNPVLSLPSVATAKPLAAVNPQTSSAEEIYNSSLLHVLEKAPDLRLNEADERVANILLRNGLELSRVEECMENSPNLGKYASEEIIKFIKRAQAPKEKDFMKIDEGTVMQMDDKDIRDTVKTTLQTLLYSKKMSDLQAYWKEAMGTIQKSLTFVHHAEYGAEIARLWAAGITKASKEFNFEPDPEIKEVYQQANDIIKTNGIKEDDSAWYTYYNMLSQVETVTNRVFEKTMENILNNPLLRVPEIATAKPISALDIQKTMAEEKANGHGSALPKTLYYSAVKEAIINHPGIGIYEADKFACQELTDRKLTPTEIKKALSISPRLEYLPAAKKKMDAESLYKYLSEGKTVAKSEGGR